MKKLFFVTGNKFKVALFREAMSPEIEVTGITPKETVEEIAAISVKDVISDKLKKAVTVLPKDQSGIFFVTDVGLSIKQFDNRPGAMIKRETNRRFGGDFSKWCDEVKGTSKSEREATIHMAICAQNREGKKLSVEHQVKGAISKEPKRGQFGFDWDVIFIPDWKHYGKDFQNQSFAQVPEQHKFDILITPAVKKFKKELEKL